MIIRCRAWSQRRRSRRTPQAGWCGLEPLEGRGLLSASPLNLAVNPVPANVTNGSILTANEVDSFQFSISDAVGSGSLKVDLVTTSGNLIPRLTLSGAQGELLIQSDGGRIVQHLEPGDYSLSVSAQVGSGNYRLTTGFTVTEPPLSPLAAGSLPRSVDVGDFNHDGFADVVVPNFLNRSVSVLLGNGDGTFQSQQIHTTNLAPVQTVVSDINGDGRPDLVTVGNHDNSTGVLLSTGGGAVIVYHTIAITNGVPIFASEPQTYFVGTAPASVTVADINGDSIPDMLVANQRQQRNRHVIDRRGPRFL